MSANNSPSLIDRLDSASSELHYICGLVDALSDMLEHLSSQTGNVRGIRAIYSIAAALQDKARTADNELSEAVDLARKTHHKDIFASQA